MAAVKVEKMKKRMEKEREEVEEDEVRGGARGEAEKAEDVKEKKGGGE